MTEEVGAVTGELEISTRPGDAGLEVAVRYAGADEWYRVVGSPVLIGGGERLAPADLHRRILEHLTTPGAGAGGNEEPTTLRGLPLA